MEKLFKAIKLTENVYWVGAIDWAIRDFHGYYTSRGSTYNAYLILGEKNILIDVVKKPFKDELLGRIRSVIDPTKIDYIISNHSELDHTGCLPEIIELIKPEKVYASRMGVKTLKNHFHWDQEVIALRTGDKIKAGENLTLSFIETKMLHWPDSMFTYLEEQKVLFSQDAFGMHLATGERFIDECSKEIVEDESEKYFANILLPFAPQVAKLLKDVEAMNLPIDIIASDHGPIWRKDLSTPLKWYKKWSQQKPQNKAVIIYDSMWKATEIMALTVSEALIEEGIHVKVMPLRGCHRTDIMREMLDAGLVLVGSPTLNNNIFPTLADVLTYMKGLRPKNVMGGVFGSYGWSGEGVKQAKEYLESFDVQVVDTLKIQYMPSSEDLEKCTNFAKNIAVEFKKYLKTF
jgi:flavorubredoxin